MEAHPGADCCTLPAPFSIRIGLHSGAVMAGVIGTRKFVFDVWGDTVNIAARLEADGVCGDGESKAPTTFAADLVARFHVLGTDLNCSESLGCPRR